MKRLTFEEWQGKDKPISASVNIKYAESAFHANDEYIDELEKWVEKLEGDDKELNEVYAGAVKMKNLMEKALREDKERE